MKNRMRNRMKNRLTWYVTFLLKSIFCLCTVSLHFTITIIGLILSLMHRGSEKYDTFENKKKIQNGCLEVLHDCIPNLSSDKDITMDCDAFSIVIIADNMNPETKNVIRGFLKNFGTDLSSTSIPSQAVGAKKIDGIFGSTRSVGCQHLKSSIIGDHLISGEAMVITSPVKISIPHSCREKIISYLGKYPSQYPMEISKNDDICFDPNMAKNKPPYGVFIDAILASCYDSKLGKYIIHVADMGTRHTMKVDGECPIAIMFDYVKKMRNTPGVSVEMCQLDIAFSLPTTKNQLIQCSYEKLPTMGVPYDSCVDYMKAEQWALHGIQTKDGKVVSDSKQMGTVRLKQEKWNSPSILSIPIPQGSVDQSFSDDDSTYTATDEDQEQQLPNIISQVYQDCDFMEMDAKSVYSVKEYSGISHYNTQKQSQLPLTYFEMNDLPTYSIVHLQRFFQLLATISGGAMKFVEVNGICARLEVSVRPSCHSDVGISLRCGAHLTDLLAHVFIVIHELFQRQKHKLTITTTPYELVYTKILSLIDQAQSLLRFRASFRFCDVYKGEQCSTWLRAIAITIMTFIGLAGETKLKYLRKWLDDDKRYNPTNQSPLMMTDLRLKDHVFTINQPEIPLSTLRTLKQILAGMHFTKNSISVIVTILKTESPLSHSRQMLQKLTLIEMWHFSQNIFHNVIPIFVTKLKKNDGTIDDDDLTISQLRRSNINGTLEEEGTDTISTYIPEHILPQDLVYSAHMINNFEDHSAVPKKKRCRLQNYHKDPSMMIILKLSDIALIFDIYTPVYVKYLYKFIKLCHSREIQLKRESNYLTKLDCTSQNHSFKHASKCLKENHSDLTSLQVICNGLDVTVIKYSGPVSPEMLIASLCKHYLFPCQLISSFPHGILDFISMKHSQQMNKLIYETYNSEIPLEMKSHIPSKLHFYHFFQDNHIWINKIRCSGSNIVNDSINSSFGSEDLYVVLDKCYNIHGIPGFQMRINLHNFLNETSNLHWLCDDFLIENATNNMSFCQSKTLNDLQVSKEFMFLEHEETTGSNFSNMCPDVILPIVSLLYKTNIFFIDLDINESHFHFFDKNSAKIITYPFTDTTGSPAKILKYNTFLKSGGIFKFIDHKNEQQEEPFNTSTSLLFLNNRQMYTTLSNHPQGRMCISNSVANSLIGLLKSNNVDHEHFRNHTHQENLLDILAYMTELVSSFPDKALSFFFNNEIVNFLNTNGVESLTSLLNILQSQLNELPHHILCPIMCLKYNLWISVWEDEVISSKKSRTTYFYWYDHTKDIVDCKVFIGHYVYLPYQTHILYIRCSKSNRFGYWKQDTINPFTYRNLYIYSDNLLCKYSYLDNPLRSKVMKLFEDYFSMNIIPEEYPYSRLKYHGNNINPTIIPLLFTEDVSYSQEKGLLVIYPFNKKENTFFGCIINNDVATNVVHKKISFFNSKLDDEALRPRFSFQNLSINLQLDFYSSFLMMVYMFIANSSRNIKELLSTLKQLKLERNIVNKSKRWIADWLSDLASDPQSTLVLPQWLKQIIGSQASSHSRQQVQESTAQSKQIILNSDPFLSNTSAVSTNIQSDGVSVVHDPKNIIQKKRKRSESPSIVIQEQFNQKHIQNIYRDKFHNSNSQINHPLFDCSANYNTESYLKFFGRVKITAGLESDYLNKKRKLRKQNLVQKENNQKDIHRSWNASTFVVAACDIHNQENKSNLTISATNFMNLIDGNWISDEVIEFMGWLLIRENETIHIFSTQFMNMLIHDFANVQSWHKQLSGNVNLLYIPIHKDGNHWILSLINFKEKEILLWNSSHDNTGNEIYLEEIKKYINKMQNHLGMINNENTIWHGKWIAIDKSITCPKHILFDDYGIFFVLNLVVLINGFDLNANSYSQEHINDFNTRSRIGQIIHQSSSMFLSSQVYLSDEKNNDDDDKKYCQICNKSGQLIVCKGGKHQTGCGHCYHIHCINRTEIPSGDWICQTCAKHNMHNVGKEEFDYSVDDKIDLSYLEDSDDQENIDSIDESDDQQAQEDEENSESNNRFFAC